MDFSGLTAAGLDGGSLTTPAPAEGMTPRNELVTGGARLVNASSEDLLGLGQDVRVREAVVAAARTYGLAPLTTSRLQLELQQRLAARLGRSSALVCAHPDRLWSLVAAASPRLSVETRTQVRLRLPAHAVFDTPEALEGHGPGQEPATVVSDVLHPLEGDLAPLPRLAESASRLQAELVALEPLGLGVLGATAMGGAEHLGVTRPLTLHVLSLRGPLLGEGAVLLGPPELLSQLEPLLGPPPPPTALAAVGKALDVVDQEPQRRARLFEVAHQLLVRLRAAGFDTGPTVTPFIPVWMGDEALSSRWVRGLAELGVHVRAHLAGVRSRLVLAVPATCTDGQLQQVGDAFEKLLKKLGLPDSGQLPESPGVVLARPGSFAMSTPALPRWFPEAPRLALEPELLPESQRPLQERLRDAMETLAWRATRLKGFSNLPGTQALSALLESARRRGR